MAALRDELYHLVEELPDEKVATALAFVCELTPLESKTNDTLPAVEAGDQWPPSWFDAIRAGRDDTSERADEILRAEYVRPA